MKDGTITALHRELIPNWTSEQFLDFVQNLAFLTDAWAKKLTPNDVELTKNFWSRILALEASFWPDV
jgi:thiaminase